MTPPNSSGRAPPPAVPTPREAEVALRRLGYAKVASQGRKAGPVLPSFWVQEPGVPRRMYPVFLEESPAERFVGDEGHPAILVVPSDAQAEAVWHAFRTDRRRPRGRELSILVLTDTAGGAEEPHWHTGPLDRRELVELATGVVVGLFRRAAADGEGGQVDFEEMLQILKQRFHVDVAGTLGVGSDEDALWMMYQLASRFTYAPGDGASNLHMIVLKPTGPASRLPWFAG